MKKSFLALVCGSLLFIGAGCANLQVPAQTASQVSHVASTSPYEPTVPRSTTIQTPKGIYVALIYGNLVTSAQKSNEGADQYIRSYLANVLDNPAISGITPLIQWNILSPAKGTYAWNYLDDLFAAVQTWNEQHPTLPPKTIQLIMNPGMQSPSWLFSEMDADPQIGSCDGLFLQPQRNVSSNCGYVTIFNATDGYSTTHEPLPMPWNSLYKSEWKTFLIALNQHIQNYPASEANAFVQISIAGPTASSSEMIMPNDNDQTTSIAPISIPAGERAIPGMDANKAWNILFANYYKDANGNPDPSYQNADKAFVDEWENAIDAYGQIFSGITLDLTATADGLPTFAAPNRSNRAPIGTTPAPGFASYCVNNKDAMDCAARTQILAHFVQPNVGGNNAKATQEDGLTASRGSVNPNNIKWLAAVTASGSLSLPSGSSEPVSRILGGLQFDTSFSSTNFKNNSSMELIQYEGCPTNATKADPMPCPGLTPAQALSNVLQIYFAGTPAAGSYGVSPTVSPSAKNNTSYSNAPMNYLQVYVNDIIYANTNPATQAELNQASQNILKMAEPVDGAK